MQKIGTINTLVVLVLMVFIFGITGKVWADVIAPSFNSEESTISYQKFQLLSSKVNNLIYSNSQTASDEMILELEPVYSIIGFRSGEDFIDCEKEITSEGTTNIKMKILKPKNCGDKGCLCLFKGEFENDKENKHINDKKVVG